MQARPGEKTASQYEHGRRKLDDADLHSIRALRPTAGSSWCSGLCQLRLMNDARWPWLLLVPQRAGIAEIFELTPLDQTMLTFETGARRQGAQAGDRLHQDQYRRARKQVRQLHVHVVARV